MRSPPKLVWSEGMLLSPHHLQELDKAYESLVAARVGALAPLDWGVVELQLDEAALAAGEVRLLRFEGVFRDGLPVSFDDAQSAPPPRPVADRFAVGAKSLDVFLAVPRERKGLASFAEEGAPSPSRYLIVKDYRVRDATRPESEADVPIARPNTAILLGDEPREDYETIKLAELVRAPATGLLVLDGAYVPPCLRVSASAWLLSSLRELLQLLIANHRALADAQRDRAASADTTAADVHRQLQLLVLGSHIPELAHIAEAGDASPRECYRALGELAAQLCAFSGGDPSTVARFRHVDLRATFEPLFAWIKELLRPFGVATYEVVPLEPRAGGLYLARLQEDRILRARLFLTVASAEPEARVAQQVPALCKITSSARIVELQRRALPGLELRVVPRPPPQLPWKQGHVYFSLVQQGTHWEQIAADRNLALYLPPPFDPGRTKLELLAIPGTSPSFSASPA